MAADKGKARGECSPSLLDTRPHGKAAIENRDPMPIADADTDAGLNPRRPKVSPMTYVTALKMRIEELEDLYEGMSGLLKWVVKWVMTQE